MREIELRLSETQKVRLRKALEQLESLSSNVSVIVADSIPVNHEDGVLKGHGTADLYGKVVATLCGVVEHVNKYVYVRALHSRYKPKIGDMVIGRVIEVAQQRWILDTNCSQNACLMLSAKNMSNGAQRRRTALDELNMRCIFEEADVVCAEVCRSPHDDLRLQERSQKYGKLSNGQLLTVRPYLVKRQKQHFHHLERYGIDLIIGCNGFIWVGEHVEVRDDIDMVEDPLNQSNQQVLIPNENSSILEEQDKNYTTLETRKYICRVANAVRVLSTSEFTITLEIIKRVVDLSLSANLSIHDMLGSEFFVMVAEREAERRRSNKRKR